MRHFTLLDKILTQANHALTTVFTVSPDSRPNPAKDEADVELTPQERRQSEGFMRVNHTGEVCAQALYRGHLSVCRSKKAKAMLSQSCDEETDHLAWTYERLQELKGRTSYINLLWYLNSYLIGVIAGIAGDQWSLGFVEETEIQVGKHLSSHLDRLPQADLRSRAIVTKMREEESQHEAAAAKAGAHALPYPVKALMKLQSKVMTSLVYWI